MVKDLSDLRPDPENPRTISQEAADGLRESLREFGDLSGITWNKRTSELVCGHQRVEQLRALGGEFDGKTGEVTIPAGGTEESQHHFRVRIVDWAKKRQRAANVAANNQYLAGEFSDMLPDALLEIKDDWPDVFGTLRFDKLEEPTSAEIVEDDVPEPPKTPITKPGDVWALGRHRVVCGDSTARESIAKTNARAAALFATDPPYGVAYGVETPHGKKIENDENDGPRLQAFLGAVFAACVPALRPNAAWYLWHAQMTQGYFAAAAAAAAADILIHRQIVWVKPTLILGHGDYHWRHELCFYGWQRGKRPPWYGDRKQTTVWEVGREGSGAHPTQKPVELMAKPIRFNTVPGEACLDPFLGSGTTLIAAEQLGRVCHGIEIEPAYCDVAVERWENLTGGKAKRVSA